MCGRDGQPVAGPDADDAVAYVLRSVLAGRTVITVVHDVDGDWQYLTGEDLDPDAAVLVHRSHLHELDPTLREVAGLPRGTWAVRETRGGAWTTGADVAED